MKYNYRLSLNIKGELYHWNRPLIMGILNLTPDSFYKGSRVNGIDNVLKKAEQMLNEGADILDFGAQSTRPGSDIISADDEIGRLKKPLAKVIKEFPEALISIDTFYSKTAKTCLDMGVHIINDISAGDFDKNMMKVVATYKVPFIAMHILGKPKTMQENPEYDDVCFEICQYLSKKIEQAKSVGINDIIVDFGFGFGKTIEHNYELMKNIGSMKNVLKTPVLIGISRKSMIWKFLDITPDEVLSATSVLHMIAFQQNTDIIRVHDVKEAVQVRKLWAECL